MRTAILAVLAVMFATHAGAETVCDQIDAFERASFSTDSGQPHRHWVEFHWLGESILDRSLNCTHSSDTASAKLCEWLLAHPGSSEFPDRMPRSILVCRGYRFPDNTYWDDWKAEITLPSKVDRLTILQIDQSGHSKPDVAIRLSTFAQGSDPALEPLPPMFKSTDVSPRADSWPQ
jgi:hypothetical protein